MTIKPFPGSRPNQRDGLPFAGHRKATFCFLVQSGKYLKPLPASAGLRTRRHLHARVSPQRHKDKRTRREFTLVVGYCHLGAPGAYSHPTPQETARLLWPLRSGLLGFRWPKIAPPTPTANSQATNTSDTEPIRGLFCPKWALQSE